MRTCPKCDGPVYWREDCPGAYCRKCDAYWQDPPTGRTDTERLDALERMVQESAARGEAVELDQRSPGLVLLSRRWPGGALEHVGNGKTLRAAIDAATEANHEGPEER